MPDEAEAHKAEQGHDEKCWHGAGGFCSMRIVRDQLLGAVVWASRIGLGRIENAAASNSLTGTNSLLGFRGPRSLGR